MSSSDTMSISETELLLPVGNEEEQLAGLNLQSQGVPMNTEMAQFPPPPTNPSSVPGTQAQLPPAQNVQLSSSPGQVFFTPDGKICFQQPNMGAQPAPSPQPGATQGGQMVLTAGGGPQMWPANQQQMTAVQVPYSVTQPSPYTPVVTAAGVDLRPPSYIVMTFIVTFICFFLNITTLMFGIPAIILSVLSEENKKKGEYGAAKSYGKIALGINIANIVYTALIATILCAMLI